MRTLIIAIITAVAWVTAGVAVTRFSVHDEVAVNDSARRCARSAIPEMFETPWEKAAMMLGDYQVTRGDMASVEFRAYTAFESRWAFFAANQNCRMGRSVF